MVVSVGIQVGTPVATKHCQLNDEKLDISDTNINIPQMGILNRLIMTTCGDYSFMCVDNVDKDLFFQSIQKSGVDLEELAKQLFERHQIYIGTPQGTVHPCVEHMKEQLVKNNINDIGKELVLFLINEKDLDGAATVLKAQLNSGMLCSILVCFIFVVVVILWHYVFCSWSNRR